MAEEKSDPKDQISVGTDVEGTVEHLAPYGAFVRLSGGQKAMVHISELSHGFVKKVEDVLELGQKVRARVIKIDEKGRIDLSIKALQPKPQKKRPRDDDDFEKRLSNFMKDSDEKFTTLNSKASGKGAKKRGSKK
ncbi:MAG: S1 RNA-binding domain-containing protein [Synergistales bacterium]|nr:S1 RNA-binding domain-containing protein [Synergistales bacterium]